MSSRYAKTDGSPFFRLWVHRELEAQPAGERGALWGVPFAVKDNIDALPHPTTAACDAFRYTPECSASTVSALEGEGAP